MKHFAIIRHEKIKAGRHLVSAGLHNARGATTPNADPKAPAVEVLVGTTKPHRDVMRELGRRGIGKVRKAGVVAVEVFMGASPEWWASKGWTPGCRPTGELSQLVANWKAEQLVYLNERFGDRLVSAIYHADEASPHVQAFAVPVVWRKDGREKGEQAGREAWRLDASIDLGSPGRLKQLVTDYSRRMERFGLVRGKNIDTSDRIAAGEEHRPLRAWQEEQHELTRMMEDEVTRQRDVTAEAERDAKRIREDAEAYAGRVRRIADQEAEDAKKLYAMREEMLRRKEDSTASAQRDLSQEQARLAADRSAVELERRELGAMRKTLETMTVKCQKLLSIIGEFYQDWVKSKPGVVSQAKGPKAAAAKAVLESDAAGELATIRTYLSGRGGSGR